MNQYFIRARLFPTILTSIPLIIFINYVLNKEFYPSLNQIYTILPTLTGFGISAAVIFLSIQVNRIISKELFQKVFFKEEIDMPTTKMLLWSDAYFDKNTKSRIRKKIETKFQIKLKSETSENSNILESKKQIIFAVSQIRNILRGNSLLFQHNIEYGFIRNLIGGSLLAVIISIAILIYAITSHDTTLQFTAYILLGIYSIPIIFSKFIIKRFGEYYAKTLYEQFLTES